MKGIRNMPFQIPGSGLTTTPDEEGDSGGEKGEGPERRRQEKRKPVEKESEFQIGMGGETWVAHTTKTS